MLTCLWNSIYTTISLLHPKSSNTYCACLVGIDTKTCQDVPLLKSEGRFTQSAPWQLNRKWRGSQSVCPPFLSVLQQAGPSPKITDRILPETPPEYVLESYSNRVPPSGWSVASCLEMFNEPEEYCAWIWVKVMPLFFWILGIIETVNRKPNSNG